MKTFITAVFAVAASFVLSWFGELYSHPIPQLQIESAHDCVALSSEPQPRSPCRRQTQNNSTSSNHPGEHP